MTATTRNKKYDKSLILLMKRQPENIMVCPCCLNVHYHKSHDILIDKRSRWCHKCSRCGKQLYGKQYLIFRDDLEKHIKSFFSHETAENHDIDHFIEYITGDKGHWWYFQSEISREHHD